MKTQEVCKVGTVLFGRINSFPPTNWRFDGVVNGTCWLTHVKHASQSVAYPDQFVTWDRLRQLAQENAE